jgi:uncharacterized protein YndB with AHSA1/START domain
MAEVQFTVHLSILKPVQEVFDAVVNPQKLSGYFTQTASAPLQSGSSVTWRFAEFPEDVPVIVGKIVPNELITLEWESMEGGYNTRVEMKFESLDQNSTLVSITESGWRQTPKGVLASYQNCGGWMNMLCCMKAYLEHGLNLRKGAFLKPEVYSI